MLPSGRWILTRIGGIAYGQEFAFGTCMSMSAKKLLPVIVGWFLYSLAMVGGFILLVIPGIYLSVSLSMFTLCILLEDDGVVLPDAAPGSSSSTSESVSPSSVQASVSSTTDTTRTWGGAFASGGAATALIKSETFARKKSSEQPHNRICTGRPRNSKP